MNVMLDDDTSLTHTVREGNSYAGVTTCWQHFTRQRSGPDDYRYVSKAVAMSVTCLRCMVR